MAATVQQRIHLRVTGTCDDQLPAFLVQASHDNVSGVLTVSAPFVTLSAATV